MLPHPPTSLPIPTSPPVLLLLPPLPVRRPAAPPYSRAAADRPPHPTHAPLPTAARPTLPTRCCRRPTAPPYPCAAAAGRPSIPIHALLPPASRPTLPTRRRQSPLLTTRCRDAAASVAVLYRPASLLLSRRRQPSSAPQPPAIPRPAAARPSRVPPPPGHPASRRRPAIPRPAAARASCRLCAPPLQRVGQEEKPPPEPKLYIPRPFTSATSAGSTPPRQPTARGELQKSSTIGGSSGHYSVHFQYIFQTLGLSHALPSFM
ncbi:extensin [Triticum aestivum]|uniref:extensin n=1 Tax=Triticum aestivum TaxID=4565 RepID=UPI001D010BC0|nr:extensin-like [Triticum aestivum]